MSNGRRALILGGCGFIGSHISARLVFEGYDTTLVDLKKLEFRELLDGETFIQGDLRDLTFVESLFKEHMYDNVFQLGADMGGAGHVFTGDHDADIMHNSATINLNVLDSISKLDVKPRIFYSSSACMYPEHNQLDPENPNCEESSAYPAFPDSEYGWEKLFSERLYFAYARNKGIDVRVARYHNVCGKMGTYQGGREKAPAALCRKIALAKDGDEIEVWGPGTQTRSFLHVNECVNATLKLMRSDFQGPVNIGSTEMISINDLAQMIIDISGKKLKIKNIEGPVGVNGRCSDNRLIKEKLKWQPSLKLIDHMPDTYRWIEEQVKK